MKVMSASEQAMLQIRKHAGLPVNGLDADETPAKEKDPFEVISSLLQAVATGTGKALLADLAKQSSDAKALSNKAALDRLEVDAHSAAEDKRLAADRTAFDAERREHEAKMAAERAEVAKEHAAATAARKEAETLRASARGHLMEMRRRRTLVENAINGPAPR